MIPILWIFVMYSYSILSEKVWHSNQFWESQRQILLNWQMKEKTTQKEILFVNSSEIKLCVVNLLDLCWVVESEKEKEKKLGFTSGGNNCIKVIITESFVLFNILGLEEDIVSCGFQLKAVHEEQL